MTTARQRAARARHLARRKHRAGRAPKGRSGFQPKGSDARAQRTVARHVAAKLKAGRPGRLGDAPPPTFDWAKVTNASQKKHWREGDNRKDRAQ